MTQEEVSERIQHRDALLNIRAILKTGPGRGFFKYLLKNYDPIFLPPMGLEGPILHEGLGQRRAYIELFNLISEADSDTAALLLAENIKERNAKLNAENIDGQS
jgi:hypothetical protein